MVVLEGKDGTKLVMKTVYGTGDFAQIVLFDLWVAVPELRKVENAMVQVAGVISGSIIVASASGGNVSGGLVYGSLASGDYQTTGVGYQARVHGITGNAVNVVLTQGSGRMGDATELAQMSTLAITIMAMGR